MPPETEFSSTTVYRRLLFGKQYDAKTGQVSPDAFALRAEETSLSLYLATQTTPKQVLGIVIIGKKNLIAQLEEKSHPLSPEDEKRLFNAKRWIESHPDAEAVYADYRIMEIPVSSIKAMNVFRLENLRADGHIDLIGTYEDFQNHKDDFINLLNHGVARVLTKAECLA